MNDTSRLLRILEQAREELDGIIELVLDEEVDWGCDSIYNVESILRDAQKEWANLAF